MNLARRIVLASFCLCVSLVFLWVPWTSDTGYSWLWSKPQSRAIQSDIVADARQRWDAQQRWDAEHRVDGMIDVEKWVSAVREANPEDKNKVRGEAKRALDLAKLRHTEFNLSHPQSLSDVEVLNLLYQRDDFQSTFPEKANLDEAARMKLISEWKQDVLPAKEWNERVRYATVDYRRIGMELATLIGLLALGFVLTPRG
jgi:hypothetical protein